MADIITTLHPENNPNDNLYPNIKKENIPFNLVPIYKGILRDVTDLNDVIDENAIWLVNDDKTNEPFHNIYLLYVVYEGFLTYQYAITHTGLYAIRRKFQNVWSDWSSYQLGSNTIENRMIKDNNVLKNLSFLPNTIANLNDINNTCVYFVNFDVSNRPTNATGLLFTYVFNEYKYQLYYTFSGFNVYTRRYNNSWNEWVYNKQDENLYSKYYSFDGSFTHNFEEKLGFMNYRGDFVYPDNYHSKNYLMIPCYDEQKFIYKGRGASGAYSYIFYDLNKQILSNGQINSVDGFKTIVTPLNARYVTFSSYNAINSEVILEVYSASDFTINNLINIDNAKYPSSVLNGKKWYACGDSFTHGDFSGLTNPLDYQIQNGKYKNQLAVYPFYIGNRTNCDVYNIASNGMTLAQLSDATNCFSRTDGLYTQIPQDADYITLYFGINDYHNNIPVGDINDNINTTFYGAWNIVISYLLNNHPNAKIGIIISNGISDNNYPMATINIAKKWGISYLDINGDSKLPMVIRANMREGLSETARTFWLNKYKVTDSNHHPNALAHYNESFMIQQWLEQL